jgi:hypothetical protein
MYDYRGISDYVPVDYPMSYLTSEQNVSNTIVTNSDFILEKPDETVLVAIYTPGIWPSLLGSLYTTLTILDAGDGVIDSVQYAKVYKPSDVAGSPAGSVVKINEQLQLLLMGLPAGVNGSKYGAVVQYNVHNNQWIYTSTIFSPSDNSSLFGQDIAINYLGGSRNTALLAISDPFLSKVYIYE